LPVTNQTKSGGHLAAAFSFLLFKKGQTLEARNLAIGTGIGNEDLYCRPAGENMAL